MKISRNWLQTYFEAPLPSAEEIARLLTFHSFEIEGVAPFQNKIKDIVSPYIDWVIDVDVLANRGSDCLCHRGIAKELSVLLDVPLAIDPLSKNDFTLVQTNRVSLHIEAKELVNRFSVAVIRGVTVRESPEWLKLALATIGQKSINNVVDATNYVMFSIGQPLHAFDARKLDGDAKTIRVRAGNEGEKITVLTGEEYQVGPNDLLITDGTNGELLGIAGIKGGKKAEIDATTKDLIIEAASFDYVSVRRTSQRLKLHTDASIRFQNQPSPELTLYALRDVVTLITDIAGGVYEGGIDWYPKQKTSKPITVPLSDVNSLLGTSLSEDDVLNILTRFRWQHEMKEGSYIITPPFERKDISIKEDVIEELGRIYGYGNLQSQSLSFRTVKEVNKRFYYIDRVRRSLADIGFSEVYTYALTDHGEVELENALASDKNHLRSNLVDGITEALQRNIRIAPLLGLSAILLFEFGIVWKEGKEKLMLGVGVLDSKEKRKGEERIWEHAHQALFEALGVHVPLSLPVSEIDFDSCIQDLPDPNTYKLYDISYNFPKFKRFSAYPFIVRDIALWVPNATSVPDIETCIRENASDLLVRLDLFDVFIKEEKKSYAFRLVFQSSKYTLSDAEVNSIMEKITSATRLNGWQVR